MNVLFIGDVFGSPGRNYLAQVLPGLKERLRTDFVIANGENAAGGAGLTPSVAGDLFALGIDAMTSGNHIWDKREIYPFLDSDPRVLRPANFPPGVPGKGSGLFTAHNGQTIGLLNLHGRVYSPRELDCPFRAADAEISKLRLSTQTIFVDFHGEATSEKIAMGYHLDGKVSAVIGTHTHVQTADEIILPEGTAYLTDAGMTGSYEGVIGVKKEIVLRRFLTQLPVRHEPDKGKCRLSGVFVVTDGRGKALSVERVSISE